MVDFTLVVLGVFSLLSYVNFKPLPSQPHYWDTFHYYIGSKYFPEIGYTRLYACVARAEAENDNPAVNQQASRRNIRDLISNEIVPAYPYVIDDTFCKSRFSALRWEAFKNDIGVFRSGLGYQYWNMAQMDRGYNASPVWTLAGEFISNLTPATDPALTKAALIDVVFLFGSAACIIWAFGLPTAAFAVIAYTASGGVDWSWIGGSLLRLDWLFMAILSVSAMKRGHYVLAGTALGYAAALRVFPAIFALGPFIGLLYAIYKQQHDLKAAYGKFFGGMIISVAVLTSSAAAVYGGESLQGFLDNTKKHSAPISAMTNNVGLRTVLTYNPDTAVRKTFNPGVVDAHLTWREAKAHARHKVVPFYVVAIAVSLLFFVPAVISGRTWQAIALGATFVPFVWAELSNYYYVFLMAIAVLFAVNRKVAFPLLGIGIVTAIGGLSGMWDEEYYTLFSAVSCIGFLVVWCQVSSQTMFGPGTAFRQVNFQPLFWRQALSALIQRKARVPSQR